MFLITLFEMIKHCTIFFAQNNSFIFYSVILVSMMEVNKIIYNMDKVYTIFGFKKSSREILYCFYRFLFEQKKYNFQLNYFNKMNAFCYRVCYI